MSKETVDLIVEGGKASGGAVLGKSLGPLGVDLQGILSEINEKTKDFKGMKVPVKVSVETSDKSFEVEVGSPSVSELVKTEINLQKGSGDQNNNKIGNLAIEQVIKIAKMKRDAMLANNFKSAVTMVIGSCQSLGVLVENKDAKDTSKDVLNGIYDKEINKEKTEVPSEKLEKLNEYFRDIQKEQEIKAKEKEEADKEDEEKKEEASKEGDKKEEASKETPKKEEKK